MFIRIEFIETQRNVIWRIERALDVRRFHPLVAKPKLMDNTYEISYDEFQFYISKKNEINIEMHIYIYFLSVNRILFLIV